MKQQLITSLKVLIIFTIILGLIYPFAMTGIGQLIFPSKANGSLVLIDGKIIGSELIGQNFDSSVYFWSRPSATGYNPLPSGASNLGPASRILKKQVSERRKKLSGENNLTDSLNIPSEMIFASGSGLDPHISPEAAMMQVDRVCEARHFTPSQKERLLRLVKEFTEAPQLFLLGERRINVLLLNIEVDKL